MASDISLVLRQFVWERAEHRCEYCRLPEYIAAHKHEPDHIIAIQHGGDTSAENLACSCMRCNRRKGPNIGSIDPQSGKLVSLFNPRIQKWHDHFGLDGAEIRPLSAEARVTVRLLDLNAVERLREREALLIAGISL